MIRVNLRVWVNGVMNVITMIWVSGGDFGGVWAIWVIWVVSVIWGDFGNLGYFSFLVFW